MEEEETVNIRFPVQFSTIYSTHRSVQRVETILDFFSSLSSFFNSIVATVISDLIDDGVMHSYEEDVSDADDAIVTRKFVRTFTSQIDQKTFGRRLLDDLGIDADKLRNSMKILAFNLVEDCLGTCYDHICGEATDRRMRLSKVLALSAVDEVYDGAGHPIRFMIEATISLDHFKRISK